MKKSGNQNNFVKIISYSLIYLTGIYPLNSAFARSVVSKNSNTQVVNINAPNNSVTPNNTYKEPDINQLDLAKTSVHDNSNIQVQNSNNAPIININAPNDSGISHNIYKEFDVSQQGLVLNNTLQNVKPQLANQISKNPNFNGKAADLIINEVTGGNKSQFQGMLEVAGKKADVIIANPNGIISNGGGFINISNATLTTGKPTFDQKGALEALTITKGKITIGDKGLNGQGADSVEIISRALDLNGKIQAKNISIIQGSNKINIKSNNIASVVGEGSKPQLAIDTKTLGGMYANQIRMVSTENGVGVNLGNLESTHGDISVNSKSDTVIVGNIKSQKNFNLTANNISISKEKIVESENNITLLSNDKIINDRSFINAKNGDVKILGKNIENKDSAEVYSGRNMWIQKNMDGDKSESITNTGSTIEVGKYSSQWGHIGDLVIRTKNFNNFGVLRKQGEAVHSPLYNYQNAKYQRDMIDDNQKIRAFNNAYIYADNISMGMGGVLYGVKNLILTGQKLNVLRHNMSHAVAYSDGGMTSKNLVADFKDEININTDYLIKPKTDKIRSLSGDNVLLKSNKINISDYISGGNLKIIAGDTINLTGAELNGGDISLIAPNDINLHWSGLSAKYDLDITSSNGNITTYTNTEPLDVSDPVYPRINVLVGGRYLNAFAGKNIHIENTKFGNSGSMAFTANENITIENNDKLFVNQQKTPHSFNRGELIQGGMSNLDARGEVLINSGKDLTLKNVLIHCQAGVNQDCRYSDKYSGPNTTLTAGRDINISIRDPINGLLDKFSPYGKHWFISAIGGDELLVNAGRDLTVKGSRLYAGKSANIVAGRTLSLPLIDYAKYEGVYWDENTQTQDGFPTSIYSAGDITLTSNGNILTEGSNITSDRNLTINAGGNITFDAAKNYEYTSIKDQVKHEKVTHKGTELSANGLLTILSEGSILFKATKLGVNGLKDLSKISNTQLKEAMASGTMDIAAKGGYLYAQALEESNTYHTTTTSRRWWGKKDTHHRTQHNVTNKVTEFSAPTGYINILSKDDSTYEASKIEAGKNTNLTSLAGKVRFKAVKDSHLDQSTIISKGFFIKQTNKGYQEDKWVLPQINIGGEFTINAAQGIDADLKVKDGQNLQDAIALISNKHGMSWVKDINKRNDVQWNKVQDAYTSWNKSNKHLNPVVGAVVAIAAAAVTAGSSLAASAASYTSSAIGGGVVTQGAVTAGMSALASKAAVSIVSNEGNLPNTFKELGDSDTVKSIVSSMVIGGALAGFDNYMGWNKNPDGTLIDPSKAELPLLTQGDWLKTAQRVAGQSIISSGLNTTISGGSFKDNFTNALLSNAGAQLGAESAFFIGENGNVLDFPTKALSHSVSAALIAEVTGGNTKGAAAGAFAAELAAVLMQSTAFEKAYDSETERQFHKIQEALHGNEAKTQTAKFIGAVAGALASGKADGVYSGANSAETVYRYNQTEHGWNQFYLENGMDMVAAENGDKAAAGRVKARQEAAQTALVLSLGGNAATVGGRILVGGSAALLRTAQGIIQGCKAQPIVCLNQAGIYAVDMAAPEAALGTGVVLASSGGRGVSKVTKAVSETEATLGNVTLLTTDKYGNNNVASKLAQTSQALLKNEKINTQNLAKLIDSDFAKNISRNSSTKSVPTADVGLEWGAGNMKQGMPWEDYVGKSLPVDARLPKNFKTFDYYDGVTRIAISAKTIDTQTTSKINNPRQIYTKLKNDIDATLKFDSWELSGKELSNSMISHREIHLAIPANTTKNQWVQINKAIDYATDKNVKLIVTEIK
jgi:filamentous hemagglutinin